MSYIVEILLKYMKQKQIFPLITSQNKSMLFGLIPNDIYIFGKNEIWALNAVP